MAMQPAEVGKTLVQCDFDGTISEEDVSFVLLDTFANGNWRELLEEYKQGRISVGDFNTRAFAMVKADRQRLLKVVEGSARIRAGLGELLTCCRRKGFRFVIVSNGLDFYIKAILRRMGLRELEVFAARAEFRPEGMKVEYRGPDGNCLDDGFKEAYTNSFLASGYRIIYVGNGVSDIIPVRLAHHIFATGELLAYCKEMDLAHTPFVDLNDVARGLKLL